AEAETTSRTTIAAARPSISGGADSSRSRAGILAPNQTSTSSFSSCSSTALGLQARPASCGLPGEPERVPLEDQIPVAYEARTADLDGHRQVAAPGVPGIGRQPGQIDVAAPGADAIAASSTLECHLQD